MKPLIIILIGLCASWYYTDLTSESTAYSVLAPMGVFVFLVAFAIWLVMKAGFGGKASGGGGHPGGFDGDGGGGDC